MTEPLMKPAEVATWLQKSKSWVYAAVERGELPSKKIGRDLRFERAELQRWLDKQSPKPTPPKLVKEEG